MLISYAHEVLFLIFMWILKSRIWSLYLYFIKIVPFLAISVFNTQQGGILTIQNNPGSYVTGTVSLKNEYQKFCMFIVAENTRSVNISLWLANTCFPWVYLSEMTANDVRVQVSVILQLIWEFAFFWLKTGNF